MIKLLSSIVVLMLLQGCATDKLRIANETQIVKVPLLYCPAPPKSTRPITEIERPNLVTDSDGDLVKAYVATIKDLQGYVIELENALRVQTEASETYDEVREKFDAEWFRENSGTDTTP